MRTLAVSFLLITMLLFSTEKAAGQTWSPLGTGLSGPGYAMAFYQGELYVGGYFSSAGSSSAHNIAKWNGAQWSALGQGVNGVIYTMCVYNNELYVGGSFTMAGGHVSKHIAKWNGTTWDTLGAGITGNWVSSIYVYNGNLYVGGQFTKAGSVLAKNIAKWDGTNWSAMGTGIRGASTYTSVWSMQAFNGRLFVGGEFDSAGTVEAYSIAQWNDTTWSTMLGFYGDVNALAVYHGALYAGGYFTYTSGFNMVNNFVKWDGTYWTNVNGGTDNWINAIATYADTLYCAGAFTIAGGNPSEHISSYKTSCSNMGSGLDTNVYAVIADEGILYATGDFTTAGGNPASHIAKWSLAGVGINELPQNNSVSVFPNPSNGIFTFSMKNNSGNAVVEIYNSLGEKVSMAEMKSDEATVDLSAEAKGFYFYRVLGDGALISSGKIVVE